MNGEDRDVIREDLEKTGERMPVFDRRSIRGIAYRFAFLRRDTVGSRRRLAADLA